MDEEVARNYIDDGIISRIEYNKSPIVSICTEGFTQTEQIVILIEIKPITYQLLTKAQ